MNILAQHCDIHTFFTEPDEKSGVALKKRIIDIFQNQEHRAVAVDFW